MLRGNVHATRWCAVAVIVAVCLAWMPTVHAAKNGEEPIPRIVLVGDSWPMFLWTGLFFWSYENGSAFKDILPGMGYGRWCDRGHTAIGGSMVTQWSTNEITITPYGVIGKLDFIEAELMAYPTLDIVHFCMGGNDYLRGDYSEFIDYEEFQMQTLEFVGDPTGGTFTLTFGGQTTAPILFGADASAVQAALEALSTIGAGNIVVLPTSGRPTYFCWFQGVFADTTVAMMTANGGGLTGDGDENVFVHGIKFDHGWEDTWGSESPAELAFAEAILEQMQIVVEYTLDVRPDVRVLVCDYDYMDEEEGGSVQDANKALAKAGLIKLEMVDRVRAKPEYANRCFYLNTFGLMQWYFGVPCDFDLVSVAPNEIRVQTTLPEDQVYGPQGTPGISGTIPLPGQFPDYVPWMGGDVEYRPPSIAIIYNFGKDARAPEWAKQMKGGNIHLHRQANQVYARFCVEHYYGAWLDLPKVLSVERATYDPFHPSQVLDPVGLDEVTFAVTFTEPVTGVDVVDFDVVMHDGLANASVESVTESKDGATYSVLVNTGSGDGTLGLAVVDNGSITALDDGTPLGGDVTGYYAYGTPYTVDRGVGLPVAVWPMATILLAVGGVLLRRSRAR